MVKKTLILSLYLSFATSTFAGSSISIPLDAQNSSYADINFLDSNNVIIAGSTHDHLSNYRFSVTSCLIDQAQLRTDFGNEGVATVPFSILEQSGKKGTDYASAMTFNSSTGSIIVAGTSHPYSPEGKRLSPSENYMSLALFSSDGKLNESFGYKGTTYFPKTKLGNQTPWFSCGKVAFFEGDKILLVGTMRTKGDTVSLLIIRFLSNGNLDLAFGNAGVVSLALTPQPSLSPKIIKCDFTASPSFQIQEIDSRIEIFVSYSSGTVSNPSRVTLFRISLLRNGKPNTALSKDGIVYFDTSFFKHCKISLSSPFSFLLDEKGNTYLAGNYSMQNEKGTFLARFLPTGKLDHSFGEIGTDGIIPIHDTPSAIVPSYLRMIQGNVTVYRQSREALHKDFWSSSTTCITFPTTTWAPIHSAFYCTGTDVICASVSSSYTGSCSIARIPTNQ